MNDANRYAQRPFALLAHYIKKRPISHAAILAAVLGAVGCSVGAQYGVKLLVDTLSAGLYVDGSVRNAWLGLLLLATLIAADNLLWRVASWIASYTFVAVTGDLRRDLFRHLTGHSPSYFAERMPGTLTSRITATSNAVFTLQNMFVWNVMPPCVATLVAIGFVVTVSLPMAATLLVLAAILVVAMFHLAAAGRPLHHEFADRAAAVDGEMVDVVGNMSLVWSFCGLGREHRRLDATIDREMTARRRSLLYLEKLRLLHAGVTVFLTIGLLGWAIVLWQNGAATTGDVVLVCTLGLSILHATRDLAVALVDVTQHLARLSEALGTLLIPHHLQDHPKATSLVRSGATVAFENVAFCYPDGRKVFKDLTLRIDFGPARRSRRPVGLRKIDAVFVGAALLRRAERTHSGWRPGRFPRDPGELTGGNRSRSAGYIPVSPLDHREHPIWPAGCVRCRRAGGGDCGQLRGVHCEPAGRD